MRWKRYEVVRMMPAPEMPSRTITDRVGSYRLRWLAEWQAGRRASRLDGVGVESRFVVREIAPQVLPTHWHSLQVIQPRGFVLYPYAHVMAGSVVIHTSLGLTRWHALGRACKWAKPRSKDLVAVARWHGERSFIPVPSDDGEAAASDGASTGATRD